MKALSASLLIFLWLTLGGCVSLTKNASDEPVDQYHGKRTAGAWVEDGSIRRKIRINLARADERLDSPYITVASFNRNVLLIGRVEDEKLKQRAKDIAQDVRHVRNVNNELTVVGNRSALTRSNDGWIRTKVKTRLLMTPNTPGRRTRVLTDQGVVYLMGLLTRAEVDAVVEATQKVRGVQKIVKAVEYID